jgi:hypothetical protein
MINKTGLPRGRPIKPVPSKKDLEAAMKASEGDETRARVLFNVGAITFHRWLVDNKLTHLITPPPRKKRVVNYFAREQIQEAVDKYDDVHSAARSLNGITTDNLHQWMRRFGIPSPWKWRNSLVHQEKIKNNQAKGSVDQSQIPTTDNSEAGSSQTNEKKRNDAGSSDAEGAQAALGPFPIMPAQNGEALPLPASSPLGDINNLLKSISPTDILDKLKDAFHSGHNLSKPFEDALERLSEKPIVLDSLL